jgi:hypothetical protein
MHGIKFSLKSFINGAGYGRTNISTTLLTSFGTFSYVKLNPIRGVKGCLHVHTIDRHSVHRQRHNLQNWDPKLRLGRSHLRGYCLGGRISAGAHRVCNSLYFQSMNPSCRCSHVCRRRSTDRPSFPLDPFYSSSWSWWRSSSLLRNRQDHERRYVWWN